MCRNYRELEIKHCIATVDGTIFASAREHGHIYNFLIRDGRVSTQNYEHWVEIGPELAEIIRERVDAAYEHIPTYRTSELAI